jgi:hypothetical protein
MRHSIVRNRSGPTPILPFLNFSLHKVLIIDHFEILLCLCARYYLRLVQVKRHKLLLLETRHFFTKRLVKVLLEVLLRVHEAIHDQH